MTSLPWDLWDEQWQQQQWQQHPWLTVGRKKVLVLTNTGEQLTALPELRAWLMSVVFCAFLLEAGENGAVWLCSAGEQCLCLSEVLGAGKNNSTLF